MGYGYEIGRGMEGQCITYFLNDTKGGQWRFCGDISTGGSDMFDMNPIAFRYSMAWAGEDFK